LVSSLTPIMNVTCCYRTSVDFQHISQRYVPADRTSNATFVRVCNEGSRFAAQQHLIHCGHIVSVLLLFCHLWYIECCGWNCSCERE
jgi:hypothetical protein